MIIPTHLGIYYTLSHNHGSVENALEDEFILSPKHVNH